jgi:hypothetical protein
MRRGIIVLLLLVVAAACSAQATVAHPEWDGVDACLFTGELAAYTGVAVCTVYVAVPIIMDMYWYSPGPTTWDGFWQSFGASVSTQPLEAGIALACDVLFLSAAITCEVLIQDRARSRAVAQGAGPGDTTVSLMGVPVGLLHPDS